MSSFWQAGANGAAAAPGQEQAAPAQKHTAFVKHLPERVARADIEALFAECGPVQDVRVSHDPRTGHSRVRTAHACGCS